MGVPLSKGSIVAMDRGYNDYQLFADWTQQGIFFVTRLKDNARYYVEEERDVPRNRNILADHIIFLADYDTCPYPLRRIVVWDSTKECKIVLLTNRRTFGATTVALLHWNLFTYRDLWEWLNDPFETPALVPRQSQQVLFA